MKDNEELAWTRLDQSPAPRRRGRRWLVIGGLALAFMIALGIGTIIGSMTGTTQASALTQSSASSAQALTFAQGDTNNSQTLNNAPGNFNGPRASDATPGANGPCEAVTVSSVSGNTIVAKSSSGSSVTIHTTASTRYTQAGKTVAASAITAGTQISVMGTHNSDGSITATSIDIGR
jgi:Domain of unknown function (DUF5666)